MNPDKPEDQHDGTTGVGFIPVVDEIPFPVVSPAQLYQRFVERFGGERCFFFRRADAAGVDESYIGLDPFETLRVRNGQVEVEDSQGQREILAGPPLAALSARLETYRAARVAGLPFFQGGALGYLNYDFVRHLEPRLKKHGSFRALEEQDQAIDACLRLFRKLVILDHQARRAYVLAGIVLGDRRKPSLSEVKRQFATASADIAALKKFCFQAERSPVRMVAASASELSLQSFDASLGGEGFGKAVRNLKEHIRDGAIFQAVLSDRFRLRTDVDPYEVFTTLTEVSPSPYQFCFQNGGTVFLGASPEMLLKCESGSLETHPIAGTRPRGLTPDENRRFARQLRRSVKEQAEHLMLVDLARNDLGRVAIPGSVKVTDLMELKMYASIMHLTSRVQATLRSDLTALAALGACFPAGTLSGAPKVRAMELISELEHEPRGLYGGTVLAASFNGDLDSCIAIRCMQVSDGEAVIQAGAGIVADSHPEREYQEVRNKTRAIRQALAIAQQAASLPRVTTQMQAGAR